MKIIIELNGVKVARNIPTRWVGAPDDVPTFGQFLKLESCEKDYVKIFAMFLGIEEEILRKAKIMDLDNILLKLKFLNDQVPLEIPREVLGYPVPKDLGLQSVGQYMDLRQDVQQGTGRTPQEQLERYTSYVAMYACEPYDWQKAEELAPKFLDAPASEVLAIGHFTLLKVIGLSAPTKPVSQSLTTRLKRFRQGLKIRLRNMGIMARYYIWRLRPDKAGGK